MPEGEGGEHEPLPDHYKRLGVSSDATNKEVQKAYRELAKEHHPDSGRKRNVAKFRRATESYEALKTEESREKYNQQVGEELMKIYGGNTVEEALKEKRRGEKIMQQPWVEEAMKKSER